jgi:hypothetical protein
MDANRSVIALLTYLGILLTFGAVFPPLALAMLVTIYGVSYFAKLKAGRMISNAIQQNLLQYVDSVEGDCQGVSSLEVLQRSVWMLITCSSWFYTLFMFDTLGSASGFAGAYWVLIVMPLMPLFLYIIYNSYTIYLGQVTARAMKEKDIEDDAIEMRDTHVISPLPALASPHPAERVEIKSEENNAKSDQNLYDIGISKCVVEA